MSSRATSQPTPARQSPVRLALMQPVGLRQELLLQALQQLGFTVTQTCQSASELLEGLRWHPTQIVLVDETVPGTTSSVEVAGTVRAAAPSIAIVALVNEVTPEFALQASAAAIDGVIDARCGSVQLADGLRQIADGHAIFPAGWLRLVRSAEADSLESHLSSRQLEVLSLVRDGLTNAEIADELMISANTVKFHLREIYRAAGVGNRVQASQLLDGGGPSIVRGSQHRRRDDATQAPVAVPYPAG